MLYLGVGFWPATRVKSRFQGFVFFSVNMGFGVNMGFEVHTSLGWSQLYFSCTSFLLYCTIYRAPIPKKLAKLILYCICDLCFCIRPTCTVQLLFLEVNFVELMSELEVSYWSYGPEYF